MPTIFFKGRYFQHDMILHSMRWYLAYSLSYRDIEDMIYGHGLPVGHSSINGRVIHYSSQLDSAFRQKKKRVRKRWQMGEKYMKVKSQWKYDYRAVEKQEQTIDFLLTATRDRTAAERFFKKASNTMGSPVS